MSNDKKLIVKPKAISTTRSKYSNIEKQHKMVEIMQAVLAEKRTPHNEPKTKRLIIDKFVEETGVSHVNAAYIFKTCADQITNFLDLGFMMERVIKDNLDTQEQLQEIKDMIMAELRSGEKMVMTRDPAAGMVSALKAKTDAQKILADSVFKQVAANIDIDKNTILEKKLDSGVGKINVNMSLTGDLDDKINQAIEIARRNADVLSKNFIEGEFRSRQVIEEENG